MQKLHVLTRKEELDQTRLANKVVVVLDVLFATSTIVTTLQHGAAEVIPVLDETAARAEAQRYPSGSYVLAGEKNLERIIGFASCTPLALLKEDLVGKRLIYSTTNGTVALRQAERAAHVYAAALLNADAVAGHIRRNHTDETVLIVCAGSAGAFNLEDFYSAGFLVDQLLVGLEDRWTLTDSAQAARALHKHFDAEDCFLRSRIGRLMQELGFVEEIRFAARPSAFPIVPSLRNGRVR